MKASHVAVLVGDFFETVTLHMVAGSLVSAGIGSRPRADLVVNNALVEVKACRNDRGAVFFRESQYNYYEEYSNNNPEAEILYFLYEYNIGMDGVTSLIGLENEGNVIRHLSRNIDHLIILNHRRFHEAAEQLKLVKYIWGKEKVFYFRTAKLMELMKSHIVKMKINEFGIYGTEINQFDIFSHVDCFDTIKNIWRTGDLDLFVPLNVPEYDNLSVDDIREEDPEF
jgi:hypothetical protein